MAVKPFRLSDRRRNQVVNAMLGIDGVFLDPTPSNDRHEEIMANMGAPAPKSGGERAMEALRNAATPAEWAKFEELFAKAQRSKKNANRTVFEFLLKRFEQEANR